MRKFLTMLAALATLSLTNCGYNAIQTNDEQVKSAWSEVLNDAELHPDFSQIVLRFGRNILPVNEDSPGIGFQQPHDEL